MLTDHQQALLARIAAQLELQRADRVLKQCAGRVSIATVWHVFHGGDHKISTLVDIADTLDCDVTITITRRVA